MRNEVQLINLGKKTPLSVSAVEFDNSLSHMHSTTQLVIVLSGNVTLTLEGHKYEGKENDLFIINPHELHKVESEKGAMVLSVNFNVKDFIDEDFHDEIIFNLNSIEKSENPKYESIRHMIFSLVRLNTMDSVNSLFNSKAIAYSLFAQLMNDFKTNITDSTKSSNDLDTITVITTYINEHYSESLSLQSIAKEFSYTESYISKLFKKSLNTTFISYYDSIRVNYSLYDLAFTKESIESIAEKCGFETSRSYVRAFRNILNMYPSDYRQEYRTKNNITTTKDANKLQKEAYDLVMEKYNDYLSGHHMNETIRDTKEIISVDTLRSYTVSENPNFHILKLGNINFLYNSSILEEIHSIQDEIRYKYIELTNAFNQSSRMYREEPDGTILLNKPMIDNILKILYDAKLSPYFSFTMTMLKNDENLIDAFINYVVMNNTYQFPKIMISLNLDNRIEHTVEEKYTYYYKIVVFYQALAKKGREKFIFLSPEFSALEDLKIYLYTNEQYGRITDYFTISYVSWNRNASLTRNRDAIKEFLSMIRENTALDTKKVILEDVNFTSQSANLLNDTLFKSSYQCKNMIDIYGDVKSVIMNHAFDITIENFFDNNPYLGYAGYYTFNYTKKASYYANLFLSKLKSRVLKKGRNYILTYEDNKIVGIVNNYTHYSDLFADNKYYQLKENERYAPFSKSTNVDYVFSFSRLNYSKAKIKITYLNKKSGSSYDIYKEIAGENVLSNEELNQMKSICVPKFRVSFTDILNNTLTLETTVEPLETQLIEITLK